MKKALIKTLTGDVLAVYNGLESGMPSATALPDGVYVGGVLLFEWDEPVRVIDLTRIAHPRDLAAGAYQYINQEWV